MDVLLIRCRNNYPIILSCDVQVIKLISQVIADFADGEIDQSSRLYDTETTMEVLQLSSNTILLNVLSRFATLASGDA